MGADRRPRRGDPMGQHARLYRTITDHPAWIALDCSAQSLYVAMRATLNDFNNGNIDATITRLKHKGFKSPSTLAKALRSLEAVGLIRKTRQGGATHGGRLCSLFRFTDQPCPAIPKLGFLPSPPTKEWLKITALREADALVKATHRAAAEKAASTRTEHAIRREKRRLQELKLVDTDSKAQRSNRRRRASVKATPLEVVASDAVRA